MLYVLYLIMLLTWLTFFWNTLLFLSCSNVHVLTNWKTFQSITLFAPFRTRISASLIHIENVFPHFLPTFTSFFFHECTLACILTIYSRDNRKPFSSWIFIMVSFYSECKEEACPPVKDFLSPSPRPSVPFSHPPHCSSLFFYFTLTIRLFLAFSLHPSLPRIYVANKSRRIFLAILKVPAW